MFVKEAVTALLFMRLRDASAGLFETQRINYPVHTRICLHCNCYKILFDFKAEILSTLTNQGYTERRRGYSSKFRAGEALAPWMTERNQLLMAAVLYR